ncbi:MAG: hypothetical protein R6U88_01415 [Candidatus Bipolaricaulota bacterium]
MAWGSSAALLLSKEVLIIGGRSQLYSPQHAHHGRVGVPVIAVVNPWPSESKSWLQTRREAVMGDRALAMTIEAPYATGRTSSTLEDPVEALNWRGGQYVERRLLSGGRLDPRRVEGPKGAHDGNMDDG